MLHSLEFARLGSTGDGGFAVDNADEKKDFVSLDSSWIDSMKNEPIFCPGYGDDQSSIRYEVDGFIKRPIVRREFFFLRDDVKICDVAMGCSADIKRSVTAAIWSAREKQRKQSPW